MTTHNRIGVGIVGLSADGGWAARSHVPALRASDRFELVGVAASTPERTRAAAEKYSLPVAATSAAELAADDRVDTVVVAVKVPAHEQLIDQILPTGKPVLCEWPLAPNSQTATELADRADAAKVCTAVGLQALHVPQVQHMKSLIADGFIGRPTSSILIGEAGGWAATVISTTAYTLDRRNGATMAAIPLGHTLAAVVDVLGDLDDLQVATSIDIPQVRETDTGRTVHKSTPDQIAFTARTHSDVLVSAHYRGGRSGGTGLLWEIRGTEGVLQLTGEIGHLQFGAVTLSGSRGTAAPEIIPTPTAAQDIDALAGTPAAIVAREYDAWAATLDGAARPATLPDFRRAAEHQLLIDQISDH
ncbi:Gfo/Idh/MocA family protein [Gordonia sputi]